MPQHDLLPPAPPSLPRCGGPAAGLRPGPGGVAADPPGLGLRFAERAAPGGVADPPAGMGVAARDRDGDEDVVMVEVVNSTPEPDGTSRTYWLRVPPRTRTAKEGVAWTFGLDGAAYAPVRQT